MREDARRFAANPPLLLGLLGVLVLAVIALFGPQLASADPNAQRIVIFFPDHTFKVPPTSPDQYYPLGTDPLGRDQLSRILYGARLTFTVVVLALLLRATLAVTVGIVAGWSGGTVDRALVIVTNAVGGIPQFLLALLLAVAFQDMAILGFTLALGLVGWAESAQFVRGEVVRIRGMGYVEAARTLGERTRGVLVRHVLRGLGPQLFGLLSLETGATLLLLAELGFLGVFMSGGAFLTDNAGRPILPARDRAPEWGQMLAGARSYTFKDQWVAFAPGVVVGAAVFVFNLLGEGVRNATDPFSRISLSPRALGGLGRAMLAFVLVSGAFFGVAQARATTISFEDALALARAAAASHEPGAPLVAAVVSYRSTVHGIERPETINFYFRSSGVTRVIRVGFPDADQNAMETKLDEEDAFDWPSLLPLHDPTVTARDALAKAEDRGGRPYRSSQRQWLVRLVLLESPDLGGPMLRVAYSAPETPESPAVDVLVDGRTGEVDPPALRLTGARLSAEAALGGPVALAQQGARWLANAPPDLRGFGANEPIEESYGFVRADAPGDRRIATVFFGTHSGVGGVGTLSERPPLLAAPVDLRRAFAAVEAAGGRALREEWARAGLRVWSAGAATQVREGRVVVAVTYVRSVTDQPSFRYDVATGQVTRTQ